MKTNIVMLVKDRVKLTGQSIRTLYASTPVEDFNLTIVNDKGTAPYQWGARINQAVLTNETPKGITGQSRNLGVYWAEKYWGRGDYLYLTDNDVYFAPGWLERLIDMSQHCDLNLIGGWNHPFLQPQREYGQKANGHVGCSVGGHYAMSHDAVAGASQLMRWSTWDAYGPLDAHAAGVGQSEDWKFCRDIIKDGGRVGSVYPRVVFNCGVTNSFGQPSPGADVMLKELIEAKRQYPELIWE